MVNYNHAKREDLGAVDYVVLSLSLLVSIGIGMFYAWRDRNKSTADYLTGGGEMKLVPMSLSLMATFISSSFLLGMPVYVYYVGGGHLILACISVIIGSFISSQLFLPIFYRLKITSVNTYLTLRYDSTDLAKLASGSFVISTILNMGVVLYSPAIALKAVTGVSTTVSIVTIGFICVFYSSVGGLKAVVWTDVIQYTLMLFGFLAVLLKGTIDAGGVKDVLRIARLGGRLDYTNMELDLYMPDNALSILVGLTFFIMCLYCTNQMQIQRTCSMATLSEGRRVLSLSVPGYQLFVLMITAMGLVMYANYSQCDPLYSGAITLPDEMLPHFVLQSLGDDYPGIPGLFISGIFSSALSTLSSGFNALSGLIWEDFLKPRYSHLSEQKQTYVTKGISVIIGLLTIAMAFIAAEVENIFQATFLFSGATLGPIFGVFCMGVFLRNTNWKGCAAGLVTALSICLWLTIGFVSNKPPSISLPVSNDKCEGNPFAVGFGLPFQRLKHAKVPDYTPEGLNKLYHLQAFYVPVFGFLICVIVGVIVSKYTGGFGDKQVDPRLMCHLVNKWYGIDVEEIEREALNEHEMTVRLDARNNDNPECIPEPRIIGIARNRRVP